MSEHAEDSDGTVRRIGRPFQPGQSGNPGGRPKGVARAFRDALGGSPSEATQGLLEIARTAKRDADRIAAWREILDRGWGKAPALVNVEGADPLEMDDVAAEIKSIAEALRAERDASEQPGQHSPKFCADAQTPYRDRARSASTSSVSGTT